VQSLKTAKTAMFIIRALTVQVQIYYWHEMALE
jgi:hypothetical protein